MTRRRRVRSIISIIAVFLSILSVLYVRYIRATSPSQTWIGNSTWTSLGPAPLDANNEVSGRVLSIASQGKHLYVGSADGGLWESTNQGQSWRDIMPQAPSLAIQSIAISAQTPNVIYLGTGEPHAFTGTFSYPNAFFGAGVLVSTDAGRQWHHVGASTFGAHSVKSLVVDEQNASRLFAAAGNQIFSSLDAGKTWHVLYRGGTSARVMQIVQNPKAPEDWYAGVEGVGLVESKDDGQTWKTVSVVPDSVNITGISIASDPKDAHVVYCFVANGYYVKESGLYKSTNDGHTWTMEASLPYVADDRETGGTPHVEVAVDPTNPRHVIVGGYELSQSFDGGQTWTNILEPHMDDQAILINSQGIAYFGTDGGIWDEGKNGVVNDINSNLNITQFYPGLRVDAKGDIWGGTQDNGTEEYIVASKTWLEMLGADGGYTALTPSHPNVVYAETDYPRNLFKSTTDGDTWTKISPNYVSQQESLSVMPIGIAKHNANDILIGADQVYESLNGGKTWTPISPDWSHNLYDDNTVTTIYWSSSGDFIVVGTKDGDVYQTQNGGKTWRNITPFGRGYIGNEMVVSILVDPHHHHRLYVIYGSNGSAPFVPYHKPQVFYSVDDGQSFKAMDGNLPKTPDSSAIMFKNSVVIGTARGVYASVWGQDSWTPVGHGLPDTPVTSIVVTPKRLYVGTNGNGVWLMPIHH